MPFVCGKIMKLFCMTLSRDHIKISETKIPKYFILGIKKKSMFMPNPWQSPIYAHPFPHSPLSRFHFHIPFDILTVSNSIFFQTSKKLIYLWLILKQFKLDFNRRMLFGFRRVRIYSRFLNCLVQYFPRGL